jgi:hypothetical protein
MALKKRTRIDSSDLGETGKHSATIRLTEISRKLVKNHPTLSASALVNVALDNYFTFSLTLYIIVHKASKRFHIGYYEGHQCHDLKWHYANGLGTGTLGDMLRRGGIGEYSLELLGKYSNIQQLSLSHYLYRHYYGRNMKPYVSLNKDDNVRLLVESYKNSKV